MERPLQKSDTAEHIEVSLGRGVALKPPTSIREQDKWEVRPLLLIVEPIPDRTEVDGRKRLLRDDDQCRASIEFSNQSIERSADAGGDASFLQNSRCNGRISAPGGENKRSLRQRGLFHAPSGFSSSGKSSTSVGTPRRMP